MLPLPSRQPAEPQWGHLGAHPVCHPAHRQASSSEHPGQGGRWVSTGELWKGSPLTLLWELKTWRELTLCRCSQEKAEWILLVDNVDHSSCWHFTKPVPGNCRDTSGGAGTLQTHGPDCRLSIWRQNTHSAFRLGVFSTASLEGQLGL